MTSENKVSARFFFLFLRLNENNKISYKVFIFNRYNSLTKLKKIKLFDLHGYCETLLSNRSRRI